MNSSIKVSILIPFYKVELFFEKMLRTVFAQSYNNLEFVFVNDCSPDNSLQILKDTIALLGIASDKYTIIDHLQNEGVAKSRTDCIKHAKGDYVYFVDADDWVDKDAISQMVAATKNGTIDIVGCDYWDEYDDKQVYHREHYVETCSENMIKCLNYDVSPVLWKMLIKRQLFDYFTITSGLNIGEDYSITVRLYYYAQSFVALPYAYYHYVHANQQKLSYQRTRSLKDHIKIVEEVEAFLKEKDIMTDEVEHQLKLRKFNIKSNFLIRRTFDYSAYKKTFPEVNGMWRTMNYSRTEKMKFWLAENNLIFLLIILKTIWNSRW